MSANEPCATPMCCTSTAKDTGSDEATTSNGEEHITITTSSDLPTGCQNQLAAFHHHTPSGDQGAPDAGNKTAPEVCNPLPQDNDLEYGITDVPPMGLSIIYILQVGS